MNIEEKLIAQIKEIVEDKSVEITSSTSLIEAKLLDSLDILELIEFLEESYRIKFNEEDFTPENFEDVSVICSLLTKKMTETNG